MKLKVIRHVYFGTCQGHFLEEILVEDIKAIHPGPDYGITIYLVNGKEFYTEKPITTTP